MISLRLQINLEPYKKTCNNNIDMYGIIAGTLTLFTGLIFTIEGTRLDGFYQLVVLILFITNTVFIVKWVYLFLLSLKINHPTWIKFMKSYSILVRENTFINQNKELSLKTSTLMQL